MYLKGNSRTLDVQLLGAVIITKNQWISVFLLKISQCTILYIL